MIYYLGYSYPRTLDINAIQPRILLLEKEGPIYDFDWSPNGTEFIVVYGFTPARGTMSPTLYYNVTTI